MLWEPPPNNLVSAESDGVFVFPTCWSNVPPTGSLGLVIVLALVFKFIEFSNLLNSITLIKLTHIKFNKFSMC